MLGGGADASLASSADEFARKACKARALEIFRQKQMETADTETESEGEQSTGQLVFDSPGALKTNPLVCNETGDHQAWLELSIILDCLGLG